MVGGMRIKEYVNDQSKLMSKDESSSDDEEEENAKNDFANINDIKLQMKGNINNPGRKKGDDMMDSLSDEYDDNIIYKDNARKKNKKDKSGAAVADITAHANNDGVVIDMNNIIEVACTAEQK